MVLAAVRDEADRLEILAVGIAEFLLVYIFRVDVLFDRVLMGYVLQSGQGWKLLLAILMLAAGVASMMWGIQQGPDASGILIVAGFLLSVIGFIWSAVGVACRSCRCRMVWRFMKTGSANDWLVRLLSADACPACGHRIE